MGVPGAHPFIDALTAYLKSGGEGRCPWGQSPQICAVFPPAGVANAAR
jgi:hypothetical protein